MLISTGREHSRSGLFTRIALCNVSISASLIPCQAQPAMADVIPDTTSDRGQLPNRNFPDAEIEEVRSQICASFDGHRGDVVEVAQNERNPFLETRSTKATGSDIPLDIKGTLISRQWHYVMPLSIAIFIMMQSFLLSGITEACDIDMPYSPWTEKVAVAVLACYTLAALCNIAHGFSIRCWADRELYHLRGVYASAATISLIGGAATGLQISAVGDLEKKSAII